MIKHQLLPKCPKKLAVVDQAACSGCGGSPVCQSYCETVTVKGQTVGAILAVPSPEYPFTVSVVQIDRCIGCGLCAKMCPWEAIAVYDHDEALEVASEKTLVGCDAAQQEALR